ncbi:iron-containing alcohol dehydrogenase [Jannaschia pohangensis]|uniref:Alcohol dehydrogenase, class IV n=1 Tax=Jannaschia pohangensis TaxID=390807 RepID=A0A1I3H8U2_9RHOB|nr:iron-containing alcohol dehydrogenase [Jannaschia pohangensis]SFI31990.1 Alcohol dehydrogenase, class IV [Jannaschia pohangensis]
MSLITYLTRVRFADAVLEDGIESELRQCGITRPFVLTDREPDGALLARFLGALPDGMPVTRQLLPNAPLTQANLLIAVERFRAGRCDGVIGFGGIAAIDMARLLALTYADKSARTRVLTGTATTLRDRGRALPVITVPTTAACGAGLGNCIRLVRADTRPVTLIGPALLPSATLCDPTLMSDEGPEAMAAAVIDVLVHCVETYLCTDWNPPADGIALEGLRRASAVLDRAVDDRGDLEARRELMAAALNGALAGQKGLGGIHALAHALERQVPGGPAPHGQLHAALAPHVLEFNAPAVGKRYRLIAETMRLPESADLPTAFAKLGERLSLPLRLSPTGLARTALPQIAAQAEADPTNRTNPRMATAADYQTMLEAAL